MAGGCSGGARADVRGADAPRAGTLARAVAGAAGLVHRAGGGSAGAQPAHGRQLAGPLAPGRSRRAGLGAYGWFPPALNPAQQATLKAAVQRPPREAGIDLAAWNWQVVGR